MAAGKEQKKLCELSDTADINLILFIDGSMDARFEAFCIIQGAKTSSLNGGNALMVSTGTAYESKTAASRLQEPVLCGKFQMQKKTLIYVHKIGRYSCVSCTIWKDIDG